jgi:hypothetical protein
MFIIYKNDKVQGPAGNPDDFKLVLIKKPSGFPAGSIPWGMGLFENSNVAQPLTKFLHFMEAECSWPCSQEHCICDYPEPDKSSQ